MLLFLKTKYSFIRIVDSAESLKNQNLLIYCAGTIYCK